MARKAKTVGVSLEPEFKAIAKQRAKALRISFSEYVRRLVEEDLDRRAKGDSSLSIRER